MPSGDAVAKAHYAGATGKQHFAKMFEHLHFLLMVGTFSTKAAETVFPS
jgi:hypothetical protein